MRRHLVLISESYPYSGAAEQTFIGPELPYLVQHFSSVLVVPERVDGIQLELDAGAVLDVTLADSLRRPRWQVALDAIFSLQFVLEIARQPWLLFRWQTMARTALFLGRALAVARWLEQTFSYRGISACEAVVYTYWFYHSTFGASLLKRKFPSLRVVSRAHGADLYEGRHMHAYIPCRSSALRMVDEVFPDSEAGTTYLKIKWPWLSSKFKTFRLGTTDPGWRAISSKDGALRIVSCSSITEVKRVDLIVEGLAALIRMREGLRVRWDHFGDGPLRSKVELMATNSLGDAVTWRLHGHVPVSEVLRWYRQQPVDVFVNVSASEGTPVSIMEAISCAIPVVATAVGGNEEIVDDRNGILLSPSPGCEELARALIEIGLDPKRASSLGSGGRQRWESTYSAERNHAEFANHLKMGARSDCADGCQ